MQPSMALKEAGKGSLLAYMASTLPPGSNALNRLPGHYPEKVAEVIPAQLARV
jgi:hypothetical protein